MEATTNIEIYIYEGEIYGRDELVYKLRDEGLILQSQLDMKLAPLAYIIAAAAYNHGLNIQRYGNGMLKSISYRNYIFPNKQSIHSTK